MTNGYKLADKMQAQFKNRGAAVRGMQASSTEELMRRAEMGRDPRVNCAEQAFRESYRTHHAASGVGARASAQRPRSDGARRAQYAGAQTKRQARTQATAQRIRREEPVPADGVREEIAVKRKPISPIVFALILVGVLMFLCLLFSTSAVYESTGEIARLENELAALRSEAEALTLELEEKNDIRKIEEIATTKLGMVKEDSLQRRYVSLSDGEHIELVGVEDETDESTGGVLLSSIFSSLGKFLERFQ